MFRVAFIWVKPASSNQKVEIISYIIQNFFMTNFRIYLCNLTRVGTNKKKHEIFFDLLEWKRERRKEKLMGFPSLCLTSVAFMHETPLYRWILAVPKTIMHMCYNMTHENQAIFLTSLCCDQICSQWVLKANSCYSTVLL